MANVSDPFQAIGATSRIAANAVAPSGVQLAGDGTDTISMRQYRLQNNGTETIFYAYGANAALAQSAAVIPTNASVGGFSYPISAGAIEVISAKTALYWSGITAGNTASMSLFVTPGKGI